MSNRLPAMLIAVLMPLLLFRWFAPTLAWQLDFWGIWLLAMILVGLPILYAEGAMAVRAGQQNLPVLGMQTLTREADKSVGWRSFAWLAVVLVMLVARLGLDSASANGMEALSQLGVTLSVPVFAVGAVLTIIAGLLSLVGRQLLMPAIGLILIGLVVGVIQGVAAHPPVLDLQMTGTSLTEWAVAVLLALVCVGAGTGLYWYAYPQDGDKKPNMTRKVMPIWLTQLAIGVVLLLISNVSITALHEQPSFASLITSLGVLLASAYLMHIASLQLATVFKQFGIWIATLIVMAVVLAVVLIVKPSWQVALVAFLSLICALELAIFSGWQMKISHLRKSLNFPVKADTIYGG